LEEKRFGFSSRIYTTPRAMVMHCKGTAFIMTRGPALVARGADQLLILLQIEGSVQSDCAGRGGRREPGDVEIIDYARPLHSVATDYANLIIHVSRENVPAALLALEPHGLVFPRESGAARLIGAAMQEFYAQADHLTIVEAEAAIEGIVALTTAFARARLANDESAHVKSRKKAALDHIDAHLGNAQLGPAEIANAANVSRASLYRLLAEEGGIRSVLLTRRLDQAMRLMLADSKDERALADIAGCCGFGGTTQFIRAFRARFGVAPRQYLALVRKQELEMARNATRGRWLRSRCLPLAAARIERTETIRRIGLTRDGDLESALGQKGPRIARLGHKYVFNRLKLRSLDVQLRSLLCLKNGNRQFGL
jgi:AraC-like DNA-binding protein